METRLTEFELIRRHFTRRSGGAQRGLLQGIGDDCARLAPAPDHELLVTTDLLVEGRHFLPDAEPRKLGHKCLAVNLSDLAAGGATPRWFTLALALPSIDEPWIERFCDGMFALADAHGAALVGGDTTRGPLRTFDVTALGEVPAGQALGRAGARPGDDVWVSGTLGGAALALVHPEIPAAAARLHEPQPRVALGQALRGLASAAIDVSDGLAGDLGHILERSGVGAVVRYADIPKDPSFGRLADRSLEQRCVLSGGDDYELLFTVPRAKRAEAGALPGVALIGEIVPAGGLTIADARGAPMAHHGGFDHFAA